MRQGQASAVIATPIGALRLFASARGLVEVDLPNRHDEVPSPGGELVVTGDAASDPAALAHLRTAATQLREYFAGVRRDFELTLAPEGTEFQRRVWRALEGIPFATTRSYGELASTLGNRNASRAVGAANGKNPIPIIVPCHRVIGADGSLTGFGGGEPTKRWLLDHEARVAGMRLAGF
jgi:methylated-DNA-[protein]-cysteine S-methyltransferase